MIKIYHNPRCGKSRQCVLAFQNENKKIEIINYIQNPLSFETLSNLIIKMKIHPLELIRTNETIWKEQFKTKPFSDAELIQIMIDFPNLMQRPIVETKTEAKVVRTTEILFEILK